MASPAPADAGYELPIDPPADPPIDPSLVRLRYRHHRARRNARVLRRQESRLAQYRFYIAMTVLIALAAAFVVGSWHEVQHLFGI